MAEISKDTGLKEEDCDQAIEKLIDLRLVRHIPPYYEISHDFIARRIANELVDSEEREFKRFKELLTTKTAAFRTTGSLLTKEELLMLYKHRQKLLPRDEELRLILSTWIHNGGPGLFWLVDIDNSKILNWLRIEEENQDLEEEARVSTILLRRKLGNMALVENDYQAFRKYQRATELAILIHESANTIPIKLILHGLRHWREEVREASFDAISERIKHHDYSLLELFIRNRSKTMQEAFEELILRSDVQTQKLPIETYKALREHILLKNLAFASSSIEAKKVYRELTVIRLRKRIKLFAQGLLFVKQGRLQQLIKKVKNSSDLDAKILMKTPRCNSTPEVFFQLINTYCEWNALEKGRYDSTSLSTKASALSATIRQMMKPEYLHILRECFHKIKLTTSSRNIIIGLLKFGNNSDFTQIFKRIEKEPEKIDYWNHTALGRIASQNKQLCGKGIPKYLQKVVTKKEFKEYILTSERGRIPTNDLLPLVSVNNRPLYIRLAAYAAIGAASSADTEYLVALTTHQYSLIAQAAAVKLVKLFGINSLKMLSDSIDEAILNGKVASLSKALRYAEMQFYSVINVYQEG